MKSKMTSLKYSFLILFLSMTAVFAVASSSQLATSVIVPSSAIDPDSTFIIDVGLQNSPTSFSSEDVTSYFGHYYLPPTLEYVGSDSPYCGRLHKINQVSCSLYAIGNSQTVPTLSSGRHALQFKLKDPVTFCSGSTSIKTIDVGIFSIDPQTQFTSNPSNLLQVQCGGLDPQDLIVSFDQAAPTLVETTDPFTVTIRTYNGYSGALNNVVTVLEVPSAFDLAIAIPGGPCGFNSSTSRITCNYGNITDPVISSFQFKRKTTSTCSTYAGSYNFKLSATASGPRTEVNAANNTNVTSGTATSVSCPTGIVSFKLLDSSSIYYQDPSGLLGWGGRSNSGRYAGVLNFELKISNNSGQAIVFNEMRHQVQALTGWITTEEFNAGMRQLSGTITTDAINADGGTLVQSTITNFSSECTNCGLYGSNGVSDVTSYGYKFNMGTLNPGETKSVVFSYNIRYRAPFSDRPAFEPRFLCNSRVNLSSATNVGALNTLSGWSDGKVRNSDGSIPVGPANTSDSVFDVLLNVGSFPVMNRLTGQVQYYLNCSSSQRSQVYNP